ncbi:hypothetical protein MIND_00859100 [Mycena indigotica]|uniref:Nucleolar pre-ribosomal-associated protein 1 n=1 Tax=Mycena indigotica TaxID=2126181 RepID=A0A8H6SHL4_9AGAR|nr:uncharacterized protein MIND_00859100 [Mycena indigotica]KAF7299108.1 hypothetical protein MIND_00859100 [Mycena indigotica]
MSNPERPKKRVKTVHHTNYTSASDIRAALSAADPTSALVNLRNQFAVWPSDGLIATTDSRLLLAQQWLDSSPGASELFTIWEQLNVRQPGTIVPVVSLVSSLLALFNSHYTFHASGLPILRTLISPPWMKRLNSYLGATHNELLLVTLKLFNAMSAFGRGKERKALLESFAWETKSLPKLLNMRRRTKGDDSSDALAKPDIRTSYMLFCLSFIEQDTLATVKTLFLEQHRDAFFSIFRGLTQDPFVVVRRVLELCWGGIWMDLKLKRTLKIGLFGEITVAHLLKIYDRVAPEDDQPGNIPADIAHHFLLAICTRPGIGICFKDRGWYPRKSEDDDEEDGSSRAKTGKIYNKILSNVLKTLKVNEDSRQQELALKIMGACPELVAGYWGAAGLTLEPRLSSKWIANVSFFSSVLALPIPTDSFLSENGVLYYPTPPPLSVVLENTFPSVGTKTHFSKGLQQASGLVQHCTALALSKCLVKYRRVLDVFRTIESTLEEDEVDGQWAKLQRDLEREVRHRVPEFQVIVAFASGQATKQGDPTKAALLSESAQRLMWMYHSCLPQLVAESRFDVGKLVQNLSDLSATTRSEEDRDSATRLNVVKQLHVLRLLNESDQFQWSGKAASGKTHSNVLLDAYCSCEIPSLQQTLHNLVVSLLERSNIFENSPGEASLWISAIPLAHRVRNTPIEGLSRADEAAAVVSFVDDCIQRCLQTPYRYIEEMQATQFSELPSPLIMTAVEQLRAKMTGKSPLPPAHLLAITTFLMRLLSRLAGIQRDLGFLSYITENCSGTLLDAPQAVQRQFASLRQYLPPTHIDDGLHDADLSNPRSFHDLFIHASLSDISQRREILVQSVIATASGFKQAICLIGHSFSSNQNLVLTNALLGLLTAIFTKADKCLSSSSLSEVKEYAFIRTPALFSLCTKIDVSEDVVKAISTLLKTSLDPQKREDRDLAANISGHWLNALTSSTLTVPPACLPWIPYVEAQDLWDALRTLSKEAVVRPEPLEMVITALETSVKTLATSNSHEDLELLSSLRSSLPNSSALEAMIAAVIKTCIPMGLSGRASELPNVITVSLLDQARTSWSRKAQLPLTSLDLHSLLYQESPWTTSTVDIIVALLHRSSFPVNLFESWLSCDMAVERSSNQLLHVVYAFLDSQMDQLVAINSDMWMSHSKNCVRHLVDDKTSVSLRTHAELSLRLLLRHIPIIGTNLDDWLEAHLHKGSSPTREALRFGTWMAKHMGNAKPTLLNHALEWAIAFFTERETTVELLDGLATLARNVKVVDSDTAQTLAGVIIQGSLGDGAAVELLSALLQVASFKPLIVNRLLQNVIQHPQFFKLCAGTTRTQIVHALHTLFHLHPNNTCQATHIQPLTSIYQGTCSVADQQLLAIFHLFEAQRKISVSPLFSQWSASEGSTCSTALEAIQTLDATLVFRTCSHFPTWRTLDATPGDISERSSDASVYDPVFLVLLFAQAMAEKVPESAFGWIEMFRTNIVGLLIRALSGQDSRLREFSRLQLAGLWAHLEFADMQEQPHVVYVMNVLRNMLPSSPSEPLRRLPSYTTLILAHAVRGIFYPSNFIYPLTARFLLQRPTLDTTDVPLLYGMLYNSGDDWKKERSWMIRFISDGMMSTDDWRVLKRRHTWELLADLFQSSEQDNVLRNSILEVLANLTCNAQATTSLILKSSLLQWIEMQLSVSGSEAVSWLSVLDNILVIVDAQKLESSTGGEWRATICRCLLLAVQAASQSSKLADSVTLAASATLRLAALSGPVPFALDDLISACLEGVEALETQVDFNSLPSVALSNNELLPPHRGADLTNLDERDPCLRWGNAVEVLWQCTMRLSEKTELWDRLMYRLLVWRAVVGSDRSPNGEWARRMSIRLCST